MTAAGAKGVKKLSVSVGSRVPSREAGKVENVTKRRKKRCCLLKSLSFQSQSHGFSLPKFMLKPTNVKRRRAASPLSACRDRHLCAFGRQIARGCGQKRRSDSLPAVISPACTCIACLFREILSWAVSNLRSERQQQQLFQCHPERSEPFTASP